MKDEYSLRNGPVDFDVTSIADAMRMSPQPCPDCGHPDMPHLDNGRCPVCGCPRYA